MSSQASNSPSAQSSTPWYKDGLRFSCTQCGACCTGPPGYVGFTMAEAEQMAVQLRTTLDHFLETYTHDTPAGRSLKEVQTQHGHDCVFLDRHSEPGKAVCTLYDARPTQCRTFPWWPSNIKSKRAWNALGEMCEGVNRGDDITPKDIITLTVSAQTAWRKETT